MTDRGLPENASRRMPADGDATECCRRDMGVVREKGREKVDNDDDDDDELMTCLRAVGKTEVVEEGVAFLWDWRSDTNDL